MDDELEDFTLVPDPEGFTREEADLFATLKQIKHTLEAEDIARAAIALMEIKP